MNAETECPVCTLYLRAGISLEEHLDTHPKDQLIKVLATRARPAIQTLPQTAPVLLTTPTTPVVAPLPTPTPAAVPASAPAAIETAPAASYNFPNIMITPLRSLSDVARAYQPRYTNERYSGPPPPYSRATQVQSGTPTATQAAAPTEHTVEAGPSGLARAKPCLVEEDVLSKILDTECSAPWKTSYGFEIGSQHRAVTIERSQRGNTTTTTTTTTEEVLMRLPRKKTQPQIITVRDSSASTTSSEGMNSPRKPSVTVLSDVKLRSATGDDPAPSTPSVRQVRASGLQRHDGKRARINAGEGQPTASTGGGLGLETSVIRKTPHPPASPARSSTSTQHSTCTDPEPHQRRSRRITKTARMSTGGGKGDAYKGHQAASKQPSSAKGEEKEDDELDQELEDLYPSRATIAAKIRRTTGSTIIHACENGKMMALAGNRGRFSLLFRE
ncbi:hypothetical protein ZHAS_00017069 [Anopheles sinensis]|uniref:C2H2-type domain-containing protein n=1 Tax=Anopheles sinensis TaxID=74873 RepID=A0A084WFR2_ANOSI|nr:hypothetical protein ZHAS_00017069 [Anopheles sinensis]